MPPDTHPQHPPAVHAPIAPSVARVDTAPLTVPSADRLRRRLAVHLAGVLAAALATRALAEVLPMEIAAGWGALVAIGLPGWAAVRLLRLDRRLGHCRGGGAGSAGAGSQPGRRRSRLPS